MWRVRAGSRKCCRLEGLLLGDGAPVMALHFGEQHRETRDILLSGPLTSISNVSERLGNGKFRAALFVMLKNPFFLNTSSFLLIFRHKIATAAVSVLVHLTFHFCSRVMMTGIYTLYRQHQIKKKMCNRRAP